MKYWALFLASVVVAVAANEDVYVSKREWDDSGLQVIGQLEFANHTDFRRWRQCFDHLVFAML